MINRKRAYTTSDNSADINADYSLEGTSKLAVTQEYLTYQVTVAQKRLDSADTRYKLYMQSYGNPDNEEDEIESKLQI